MAQYIPFIDGSDLSEVRLLQHEIYKYEDMLQDDLLKKTEAYYAIEHGRPHTGNDAPVNVKNYKTNEMKLADKNDRIREYEEADRKYQDTAGKLLGCYLFFAFLNYLDHRAYLKIIKIMYKSNVLTSDEKDDLEYMDTSEDKRRTSKAVHNALLMRMNILKYHNGSKETQEKFKQLSKDIRKDMFKRRNYYKRKLIKKNYLSKEFIEL